MNTINSLMFGFAEWLMGSKQEQSVAALVHANTARSYSVSLPLSTRAGRGSGTGRCVSEYLAPPHSKDQRQRNPWCAFLRKRAQKSLLPDPPR